MLLFVLAGLTALFIVLQSLSMIRPLSRITLKCSCDMKLVAPGERMNFHYTVTNTGALPVLCLSVSFSFSDDFSVCEDAKWQERYVRREFSGFSVGRPLFLWPHASKKGRFAVCVNRRGLHRFGKRYLEAGDFLGLTSSVVSRDPDLSVICTAATAEEDPQITILGGFIGDISVRRFIMDDPSILLGYRDYTGHEPMKDISWLQSAKTGKLMVKQHDFTLDVNVAVVVNMSTDSPRIKDVEQCFCLTRSVCEKLEEMKIPYAFMSNGDLRSFPRGMGRGHLGAILKNIGLSSRACYQGLPELIDACIAQKADNRSYIVISPQPDPETLRHLRRLQASCDHEICTLYGNGGAR